VATTYNEQVIVDRSGNWNSPDPSIGGESLIVRHSENGRAAGVTFMNDGGGHFVQQFAFAQDSQLPAGEAATLYADWHGLTVTGQLGMLFSVGPLTSAPGIGDGSFVFANGNVAMRNDLAVDGNLTANNTLTVHGDVVVDGDVSLSNADCAEEFDVHAGTPLLAGMVAVLTPEGPVTPCQVPYDNAVVGVVSGAGTYRPALILDRRNSRQKRVAIGLLGKVFCWVDASYGAIKPGDLLTTSATLGHAMRATDRSRAWGATIGKAMAGLSAGRGLLPILVCQR